MVPPQKCVCAMCEMCVDGKRNKNNSYERRTNGRRNGRKYEMHNLQLPEVPPQIETDYVQPEKRSHKPEIHQITERPAVPCIDVHMHLHKGEQHVGIGQTGQIAHQRFAVHVTQFRQNGVHQKREEKERHGQKNPWLKKNGIK